jgi:hypothetical protein
LVKKTYSTRANKILKKNFQELNSVECAIWPSGLEFIIQYENLKTMLGQCFKYHKTKNANREGQLVLGGLVYHYEEKYKNTKICLKMK